MTIAAGASSNSGGVDPRGRLEGAAMLADSIGGAVDASVRDAAPLAYNACEVGLVLELMRAGIDEPTARRLSIPVDPVRASALGSSVMLVRDFLARRGARRAAALRFPAFLRDQRIKEN